MRWIAPTAIILSGVVVAGVVGIASGAPAQLVQLLLGTSVVSNSNPLPVDCVTGCSGGGGSDVNIAEVGGNPVTTTVPVSGTVTVQDGGGSITVDGTVAATQSGSWNIGTVGTITNPVVVQDGGSSITVDGTVAATQSGTWTVQPGNTANTTPWLASISEGGATAQVSAASGGALQVDCVAGCGGGGGGGGTSSTYGSAFPSTGTAVGFEDSSGNMAPVVLEADGSLPVTVGNTVGVSGTVAATQSGTWNVGTVGTITNPVTIQDGGNSITVDGSVGITGTPAVTQSGTWNVGVTGTAAVTQSGTWTLDANSGVDIGDVTINNAGGGAAVNIQDGGNSITVDGSVGITGPLPAGSNVIGTASVVGTVSHDSVDSGNPVKIGGYASTAAPSAVAVADRVNAWYTLNGAQMGSLIANTVGGCTPGKLLSAATTNSTAIKASAAGTLCSMTVINTTATLYYLKLYDTAAAPTCNSSTVVQTIPIPASTTGAGVSVNVGPYGFAFTNGIGMCLTGGLADNDNTSAAAGVAISYSYR